VVSFGAAYAVAGPADNLREFAGMAAFLIGLLAVVLIWGPRPPRRVRLDADGIAGENASVRWDRLSRARKGGFRGSEVYLSGDSAEAGKLRLPPAEVVFRDILPRVRRRRPEAKFDPRVLRALEQPRACARMKWWAATALALAAVAVASGPWVAPCPALGRWIFWGLHGLVVLGAVASFGAPRWGTADWPASEFVFMCFAPALLVGFRGPGLAGPRLYAAGALSAVIGLALLLTAVFPPWIRRVPLWGKLGVLALLVAAPACAYQVATMFS